MYMHDDHLYFIFFVFLSFLLCVGGGGSSFQRLVEIELPNGTKATKRYMIYRCVMKNEVHHWFISSVPPGKEYGTNQDTDFYSLPSTYDVRCSSYTDDVFPPLSGWKANGPSNDPSEGREVRVTWKIVDNDANNLDSICKSID